MSDQNNYGYTDPVAKLLTLGDREIFKPMDKWVNYPTRFAFAHEHVPALIDMVLNSTLHKANHETSESWAPVHAWRALGQLRAVEAAEPLTRLFHVLLDQDDGLNELVNEELPAIFSMIGPATLPALGKYLQDTNREAESREGAVYPIARIAEAYPEASDEAYALLIYELMHAERNDGFLNAVIIAKLLENKVEAALPAIEHAFKVGEVDTTIAGDWEEIQDELGLITLTDEQKEVKAKARQEIFMNQMFGGNPEMMNAFLSGANTPAVSGGGSDSSWRKKDKAAAKAKKNKRKQAAKSRKVNRKKK